VESGHPSVDMVVAFLGVAIWPDIILFSIWIIENASDSNYIVKQKGALVKPLLKLFQIAKPH
jgi:hypothetical protein